MLPVRLADGAREPVRGRRHEDEVNVVRHQAIGPARHRRLAAAIRQEIAIERIVPLLEENRVGALR